MVGNIDARADTPVREVGLELISFVLLSFEQSINKYSVPVLKHSRDADEHLIQLASLHILLPLKEKTRDQGFIC